MNIFQKFVFFLCLASVCGCSKLLASPPDPELKRTLVLVSSSYLGAVVLGDLRGIQAYSIWSELTHSMGEEKYLARLEALQNRWNDDDHPIKQLDLDDVSVRGDSAVVQFRKVTGTSRGTIWVKLLWNGSGWSVVDDSLFGDGELIAKLTEKGSA